MRERLEGHAALDPLPQSFGLLGPPGHANFAKQRLGLIELLAHRVQVSLLVQNFGVAKVRSSWISVPNGGSDSV